MSFATILSVAFSAGAGALLRWMLGAMLNPIYPSIPLGTLAANLIGGFLMGIFMAITKNHLFLPEAARLAITTGFLGGLTTFSTFSGEAITLFGQREYLMMLLMVTAHVIGSLCCTILGVFTVKIFTT